MPNLDLIRKYANPKGDRGTPPKFVGREKIIGELESILQAAGEDPKGRTVLIEGAPGAGKTALLDELQLRWAETGVDSDSDQDQNLRLTVIEGTLETLSSPEMLAREVISAVDPELFENMRLTHSSTSQSSGSEKPSAFIAGRQVGSQTNDGISRPPDQFNLAALGMLPSNVYPLVCLFIDEIQQVEQLGKSICIGQLHRGFKNLPIVPIYAGLSDSLEKIRVASSSPRFQAGHHFTLSALGASDVATYLHALLDDCEIGYQREFSLRLAQEIYDRSDGWPQHMFTEVTALFAGLDTVGGELDQVDFARVQQTASDFRNASYAERCSMAMVDEPILLAKVLRSLPDEPMSKKEIMATVERFASELQTPIPNGLSASAYVEELLHQGVLHHERNLRLSFAIPSFRSWLIEEGESIEQRVEQQSKTNPNSGDA